MKDYISLIKDNLQLIGDDKVGIIYNFQAPENEMLISKYDFLDNSYDCESEKIFGILNWLNKHIKHTGNYANEEQQDALTLLEYAYDKDTAINCLAMSIILCECLLATRIKARVMYMMPASSEDGDNHVVVEAYASDLNKWIMLDPTYGSYCVDNNGNILNLFEMRNYIANDKAICFSDSINYNGEKVEDLEDVKEYYAKNLFFLRCKSVQGYGQHVEYGNMLEFAPMGFDVHKRMVDNLEYRIANFGDCYLFQRWKKYEVELQNVYADVNTLYE